MYSGSHVADFYARMQSTSKRLIKKFKQGEAVYVQPGLPASPFTPGTEATQHTVDAVQAEAKDKKSYVDGGYIVSTDILLIVSPFAVAPEMAGKMIINDEQHEIVMIDNPTIEPTAPLLWFVACRK